MVLIHKKTAERVVKVHDKFFISDNGEVYDQNMATRKTYMRGKYKTCYNPLIQKHCFIHRLVAEIFVENKNPKEYIYVNHIDGDRFNNSFNNLEWCTAKMNTQNVKDRGRFVNPPIRSYNKLGDENYLPLMVDYYFNQMKMRFLVKKYGLSKTNIRANITGRFRKNLYFIFMLSVFGYGFLFKGEL